MTDQIPAAEREVRPAAADERPIALFQADEGRGFHARWDAIQTGFVDEPRAAVEQAHALVDEMTNRLTDGFTRERARLEEQWSRGQDASTFVLRAPAVDLTRTSRRVRPRVARVARRDPASVGPATLPGPAS